MFSGESKDKQVLDAITAVTTDEQKRAAVRAILRLGMSAYDAALAIAMLGLADTANQMDREAEDD